MRDNMLRESSRQVVAFRGLKTTTHQIPTLAIGAYKFDAKKKWVWVQRTCFYLLKRIGCVYHYNIPYAVVNTFHVDGKTLAERLLKQRHEFYNYHNKAPTKVFMGSADYHTLMGEVDQMTGFSVNIKGAYNSWHDGEARPRIHDMEVTVLPTMEGILVLP